MLVCRSIIRVMMATFMKFLSMTMVKMDNVMIVRVNQPVYSFSTNSCTSDMDKTTIDKKFDKKNDHYTA